MRIRTSAQAAQDVKDSRKSPYFQKFTVPCAACAAAVSCVVGNRRSSRRFNFLLPARLKRIFAQLPRSKKMHWPTLKRADFPPRHHGLVAHMPETQPES